MVVPIEDIPVGCLLLLCKATEDEKAIEAETMRFTVRGSVRCGQKRRFRMITRVA
jgi:hypothetical protein